MENKIKWKTEKEQLEELEERKFSQDRKKYGRDGYIQVASGKFKYKGIFYLIKVLRYFNMDDGFKPIHSSRISDYHAVVESPKETEELKNLVDGLEEFSEFLFHDTQHTYNDKQNIAEQIQECCRLAKADINSLPKLIKNVEKRLKKLVQFSQKEEICECGHKQWEEHKCTFEPMVAQECNVKGCKCKKFRPKQKEEKF